MDFCPRTRTKTATTRPDLAFELGSCVPDNIYITIPRYFENIPIPIFFPSMSQSQSPHQTIPFRPEESTGHDRGTSSNSHVAISSPPLIGSHRYPPQSTRHQISPSYFYDSSDLLFSMYLRIADRKRAELLKADTDPILVFASCRINCHHVVFQLTW